MTVTKNTSSSAVGVHDRDKAAPERCSHCGKANAIMMEMEPPDWWLCVRCWLDGAPKSSTPPKRTKGGKE